VDSCDDNNVYSRTENTSQVVQNAVKPGNVGISPERYKGVN